MRMCIGLAATHRGVEFTPAAMKRKPAYPVGQNPAPQRAPGFVLQGAGEGAWRPPSNPRQRTQTWPARAPSTR